MIAGMMTHTSITDLLNLTIKQFTQVFLSIINVMEKRKNQ